MKQIISTTEAPAAIGAYSQAVVANGMLFASGQLGIDPATGEFAGEDFRSQAEQAVKNVAAILKAVGTDASHVVKTTVFLTDMANFAVLNEVYSTLFAAPFPARSAVAVAALPKGGLVEIEILAVVEIICFIYSYLSSFHCCFTKASPYFAWHSIPRKISI